MNEPWTMGSRDAAAALLALGVFAGCGADRSDAYPEFGFEASYDVPPWRPSDGCDFDNGGPETWPWTRGPHERFGDFDATRLACESREWFEESSVLWSGYEAAQLRLMYPSGDLKVEVHDAAVAGLSWEEQLQGWFERFPPAGEGLPDFDEQAYEWTLAFGEQGEVRGVAQSDTEAVARMRAALSALGASPLFARPTCGLTLAIRPSSHVMNCYTAEVDAADRIDELPLLVEAKRAQYAR